MMLPIRSRRFPPASYLGIPRSAASCAAVYGCCGCCSGGCGWGVCGVPQFTSVAVGSEVYRVESTGPLPGRTVPGSRVCI